MKLKKRLLSIAVLGCIFCCMLISCKSSDSKKENETQVIVAEKEYKIEGDYVKVFTNTKQHNYEKKVVFSNGANMSIQVISIYTGRQDSAIKSIKVYETAKVKNFISRADLSDDQFILSSENRMIGSTSVILSSDKVNTVHQNSKSFTVWANGEIIEDKQ